MQKVMPDDTAVHIKFANGEEIICGVPCIEYLTGGTGFVTLSQKVCRVVYSATGKVGERNMDLLPLAKEHPPNDPTAVYHSYISINPANIVSIRVLSHLGSLYKYYREKTSGLVLAGH